MNRNPRMRAGADFLIDMRVMRDHHHVVFGDSDVHLQEVHADSDGVAEGGNGVLRIHRARAAMSVNQDPRSSVQGHKKQDRAGAGHQPPVGAVHCPSSSVSDGVSLASGSAACSSVSAGSAGAGSTTGSAVWTATGAELCPSPSGG